MKILLATPIFPPEIGGPATYIKELVERVHHTHELTIIAYASTAEPLMGAKLITISKKRPLPIRLLKFTWELWKAAKGQDVIYAQNAVAAGIPSAIVGKLRGIPVVIKFVGDESWERATQKKYTTKPLEEFLACPDPVPLYIAIIKQLQAWTLRSVDVVTTPSLYLRNALVESYHLLEKKAVVNYNATEKADVFHIETIKISHQVVATARLVEWKGIDGIIRAVALLKNTYPDLTFLVAGDGPDEAKLKELAKELNVEESVKFLGRVSRAETWHIRKTSEVYVLNSTYEGLPHTVLTSFSAGIATVATDIPGTNEAVLDGQTGLLVPVGNDQALADAIARLFENPALREQLIANAKQIIVDKFSWDAHLKNLFEILRLES